jgi:NAD-dependent DNA ligase
LFRSVAYYCSGNITEWTRCSHRTQDPKRQNSFSIPADLKKEYTCLKNFKFKANKRLFAKTLEEIDMEKKNGTNGKQPLLNLNFSSAGKLSRKNPQLKMLIERLGGKFKAEVNNVTVAVISNKGNFINL